MKMQWMVLSLAVGLAGCQSTHDQLLAEGYPPAFADGYQDGCGSGRQAAGSIGGEFKKDAPRFLKDQLYSQGWTDGFRQCQAMQENRDNAFPGSIWNDRDRDWEREKTRSKAEAYNPR
jgi:hypothetical protein